MNIPELVYSLNKYRSVTAMEAGLGATVTDMRLPYLTIYLIRIPDDSGMLLARARWEYPKPGPNGRIPGLTRRQAETVAKRRVIDAGVMRVSADEDAAGRICMWLDYMAGQFAPHDLTDRAPSPKVADAWRGLLADALAGTEDATTRRDRRTVALALCGRVGPAFVRAMLADTADGGDRTAHVRDDDRRPVSERGSAGASADTSAGTATATTGTSSGASSTTAGASAGTATAGPARFTPPTIRDERRMQAALRALGDCITLVPDWKIRELHMHRRDWMSPLIDVVMTMAAAA